MTNDRTALATDPATCPTAVIEAACSAGSAVGYIRCQRCQPTQTTPITPSPTAHPSIQETP
jgi:hypothetical protein